ncbi:MAG TPA: Hpt domain-containing protein [Terracidiphilus sp.]|nr:Hpt domain-containing protein [Terracidiphilus sp.]
MNPVQQTAPPQPPDLAAALERLWQRHLPEIESRLDILDSAAAATAASALTPDQKQAAHAAAHKLAGVLGSFGLSQATDPARETERLYAADSPPSRESAARLARMAATLRSLVANHMRPQPPAK